MTHVTQNGCLETTGLDFTYKLFAVNKKEKIKDVDSALWGAVDSV